jgi:hypothetical protein
MRLTRLQQKDAALVEIVANVRVRKTLFLLGESGFDFIVGAAFFLEATVYFGKFQLRPLALRHDPLSKLLAHFPDAEKWFAEIQSWFLFLRLFPALCQGRHCITNTKVLEQNGEEEANRAVDSCSTENIRAVEWQTRKHLSMKTNSQIILLSANKSDEKRIQAAWQAIRAELGTAFEAVVKER